MTLNVWLPLIIVCSSLLPGIIIFFLSENAIRTRTVLNLMGAVLKLVLVAFVYLGYRSGEVYLFTFQVTVDLHFMLRVDALALLFAGLSSVLWLVTTIYAIGYLEGSPNRRRFFGFFSMCVTASTGIALSGNLVTFFVFYEFLTLATYPLVVHRGTRKAVEAGRNYLFYTIGGGTVLFVGIVALTVLAGPVEFGQGAQLANFIEGHSLELKLIFWMMLAGLAVKAAIFPFHGWLPVAMVAPAPVSALLHAVAVVKAGAFGIIRLVYDVYGVELASELSVLPPLAVFAAFTIIYGSLRAISQDDLKKRLAYSTVSQLSYIALGAAVPGMLSSVGAIVHLVHQGIMKITLFFCAGVIAETTGAHKVSELNGIGRRLPLTMAAFTIGALGMIGLPPVAGFVSKWYLSVGALSSGQSWVVLILLGSSALNAIYFLPIIFAAWFKEPPVEAWPDKRPNRRFEAPWMLLFPPLVTAIFSLAAGLFAASSWSPLSLARRIVERVYFGL